MPSIFGRSFERDELRRLVGGMAQLAGIRLVDLADGRVRGMRAAEVFTGSGFRFQVLVDRGLDLGAAEHAGRPLAWLHPALGSPSLREPHGIGWLRTFGGGLVTTCGLDHFGPPDPEGEGYGLHGRASHLPAENLRVRQEWRGDEYVLEIEGETRQARLFGENLRLERRVSTRLGATSLVLEDRVTNEGFRPAPLAVLYHCNFGFPVVSPDSELLVRDRLGPSPRRRPRAPGLRTTSASARRTPGFAEQVFFHEPRVGPGWPRRRRDRQPRARLRRVRALARGGAAGARPLEDDRGGRVRVRPRALDPRHDEDAPRAARERLPARPRPRRVGLVPPGDRRPAGRRRDRRPSRTSVAVSERALSFRGASSGRASPRNPQSPPARSAETLGTRQRALG